MTIETNHNLKDFVIPAIGYLMVGLICVMAGNSLHTDLTFNSFIGINIEQFLYWLLLVPIFINRVIMYEQNSSKDILNPTTEWKKISLQFPLILLIFTLFVFFFLIFLLNQQNLSTNTINYNRLFNLLIAIAPMYIQTIISWKKWKENKATQIFNFRNYIFFPALSTCLISYMVGWTQLQDTFTISAVSLGILFYYGVSFYDKSTLKGWKWTDWIFLVGIISLLIFLFLTLPINKNLLETSTTINNTTIVLMSCILMTLIMGITETWWFIKDLENKAKFSPADIDFYENRINKFTASLPLILPLAIFNPQTNNYFYSIIIYSGLLCAIWFYGQSINNKYWRWIRFSFGIILPVLFAVSLKKGETDINFMNGKSIGNVVTLLSALIGLFGFLRNRDKNNNVFSELSKDKQIGIVVCVVLSALLLAVSQFLNISDEIIIRKINLISFFLFIMVLVFTSETFAQLFGYSIDGDNTKKDSNKNNLMNLFLFIKSGRPITSLLSGFLALFVFVKIGAYTFLDFYKLLPIVIVTMLGFVYNDIYDKEKDSLSNKKRPIASGKLSSKLAFKYTLITSILVLLFEIYFNNIYSFIAILITLTSVFLYSPLSRKFPLTKTFYTSLLCCMPFIYGYLASGNFNINIIQLLPIIIFIIGREIWLDSIDLESDKKYGIVTLSSKLTSETSKIISFILMFLGGVCILLIKQNDLAIYCTTISMSIIVLSFYLVKINENLAVNLTRISMFLGMIALLY